MFLDDHLEVFNFQCFVVSPPNVHPPESISEPCSTTIYPREWQIAIASLGLNRTSCYAHLMGEGESRSKSAGRDNGATSSCERYATNNSNEKRINSVSKRSRTYAQTASKMWVHQFAMHEDTFRSFGVQKGIGGWETTALFEAVQAARFHSRCLKVNRMLAASAASPVTKKKVSPRTTARHR